MPRAAWSELTQNVADLQVLPEAGMVGLTSRPAKPEIQPPMPPHLQSATPTTFDLAQEHTT
jgi:hypothetical protein